MTSLRTRLFRAIALIVLLCVALTFAVGLVLTRRAVDAATLNDVAHQADLVAGSQRTAFSPFTHLPELLPYFERQHETYLTNGGALPKSAQAALKRGKPVNGTVSLNGHDFFFAARRVKGKPFVLLRPRSSATARLTPFAYSLLIAALVSGALAALAAFLLARRIARPVHRVAEAARSLARGTRPEPVPVEGAAELATLAIAFNDLADQLGRAREAEKSFLLSVSHELKTPLTSIRGYAEALAEDAVDPSVAAETLRAEAGRLERLVHDLLDLARMNRSTFDVRREPLELGDAALEAVRRYEPLAQTLGVTLEARLDAPAQVLGDEDRVQQVIGNLVENALRVTPAGGGVRVCVERAAVRVEDDGPGLEPDELARAFERFYLHSRYGKDRKVGTGLGLAIVKELTQAMGGTVEVDSGPDRPTTFTVRLAVPARQPAATT
jgi:two-component system sensor histidine kinase BaeS